MSAGCRFKGINKGKTSFNGINIVETTDGTNVFAGGEFDGEQLGDLNLNDKNTVKIVGASKQENVDQPSGSCSSSQINPLADVIEPKVAKIEPFQSIRRVGSDLVVQPSSSGRGIVTTNSGSFTSVRNVKGNITQNLFYRGSVPDPVSPLKNLPTNCDVHTNIGDVTHVEEVGGDVTFNADVHISKTTELGFQIKGHVTIFNQEFNNSLHFRDGSANDVAYLEKTFKRLGIEPIVKPDLKYKEIIKEIDSLSTTDFSAYKLFVCIFMSHGHGNGIVSSADKEFKLKPTIIDPIMQNSSLNGIPKIFITVACRGSGNYEEFDSEEFDGHILSTANGIDYSNCIISYSTYEGHVSKRTRNGTYFIQYLCDNINEDNGDTKIHSIFADVNGKLAKMFKQVPVFETTMGNLCFKDLASDP